MKLTMLGTGNALVTECYNTCFVLSDGNDHFMVDGGGGMTVLHQLKYAGLDWRCAAWLHDVGYAPSLVETGLHALDGARFLRDRPDKATAAEEPPERA